MRVSYVILLLSAWVALPGCAYRGKRFVLTAKLLAPAREGASVRLAVALQNTSERPHRVVMLTDLFEGNVYLRIPNGDVYEFTQREYLKMSLTAVFLRPTIELLPGASYGFEHSLTEFVDWRRPNLSGSGESIVDLLRPVAAELQPGCRIWCTLEVRQWKSIGGNTKTSEATALLATEAIPYPER
jgi:hypothetical protein